MSGELQPRDSARWKWQPNATPLIVFGGASGSGTQKIVKFRVPVPDSRLRVKISILFIPQAGLDPQSGLNGTIWIYETEDDISGTSGKSIPSNNVEGTQAAPTAIPVTVPLQGYSREFITAADALEGELSAVSGLNMIGAYVLQVRYQPDAVRFTAQEWKELMADCAPRVFGGVAVVP